MFYKKQVILVILLVFGFATANAQYYYKDIYKTFRKNKTYQLHLSNHIKEIRIISFDSNNQPVKGFTFIQTFNNQEQKTTTLSKTPYSDTSKTISYFDNQNRVIYTIDSSSTMIHSTKIYYNQAGKIDSLVFLNKPAHPQKTDLYIPKLPDTLREKHIFYYSPSGNLEKMEKIKNRHLYKTFYFKQDSLGYIFKEYQKKDYSAIFYYRHKDGKLTDIFHYSFELKKMIPDYLFSYNSRGLLFKKTIVKADKHNYLRWHYTYNDQGEIIKQEGYDDSKQLQGKLIYKYNSQP